MKQRHSKKVPVERSKDRLEDYRGELKKLRKQVAQLQKENARLRNRDEDLQDLIEEFSHVEQVEPTSHKVECSHCYSKNTKLLDLRYENSHYNCLDCGKTGPVKNE